ncbi:GSCOCG00008229001-RA-CDS, partial [Cotesia congregata]
IINTDGISLIKSAKSHCWPLLCTIAELPVTIRESFVLNLGLWYSKEFKPSIGTFLRPLQSKLDECFKNGVKWNHPITNEVITSKIVPSLIIADAPARAKLQNIFNFNGRYGCNICEIRTKKSQTIVSGKRAIKGYSILSCFPLLDLGTCLIPEFMHSVLLGVTRRLFDTYTNKPGPWSIKPFMKNINEFILNIRPPLSFNRMPRSLSESNLFKASEFYNLLLFYCLPALKDFLLEKYFQHLMGLVIAIFILLMDYITVENLEEADKLLRMFVKDIPDLFDDKELTYNVHQLLHLVLSVKRWGPLSGSSAFTFENYNGFIAKKV